MGDEVTVILTMAEEAADVLRPLLGTSGVVQISAPGSGGPGTASDPLQARVKRLGSLPDAVRNPDTPANVTSEPVRETDHREYGGFNGRLRLCDDRGWVSDEPIDDPEHQPRISGSTYLDRHNARSGQNQEKPFACTGSAHFGGEYFRCSSPFHQAMS